jgi:hypothetical protein
MIDWALYEAACNRTELTDELIPYDAEAIRSTISQIFVNPLEVVIGHRWSAGISNITGRYHDIIPPMYYNNLSFVDTSLRFAACGDYLAADEDDLIVSTVEGAVLSGYDAAKRIIEFYDPPALNEDTHIFKAMDEAIAAADKSPKEYTGVFSEPKPNE